MFTHYVQTGSKNTQTCRVEVVILIQHQILITNYWDSAGFSKFEVICSIKLATMHQMGAKNIVPIISIITTFKMYYF